MQRKILLSLLLLISVTCTTLRTGPRRPAAASDCPSDIHLSAQFSAADIRRLAEDPSVKSVEDMLACLTRDLDLKTLLLHTSFAAQNSNSKNPRVLLLAGDKKKADAVFSVNSGDPSLNQHHSIELMLNSREKNELEYYDIDFSEARGVMSAPNPETCLSCHGVDIKVPIGGPKPLFDRDPWSRVVLAGSDFTPQSDTTGNGFCENRRRIHYALEAQSLKAFETKPRYRSLVSLKKIDATDFDFIVRELNSRRIAQWIVRSPDYQEFKWAIFAAAYFCVQKPEDVFSPRQLERMTGTRTLAKAAVEARNESELNRFVVRKQTENWKQSLAIDKGNVALMSALKRDEAVVVGLPNVDSGGQCRKPYDRLENQNEDPTKAARLSLFDRYLADTTAWGGDFETSVYRFIFESRGLDISDWNTQPTPGYGRGPGQLLNHLLDLEPKSGPDYAVLKEATSKLQYQACPLLVKLAKDHF